jgi:hypothetical protein
VLFGVGFLVTLVGDWRKNCPKMVAIGPGAAAVGSFTACLFRAGQSMTCAGRTEERRQPGLGGNLLVAGWPDGYSQP